MLAFRLGQVNWVLIEWLIKTVGEVQVDEMKQHPEK
jgi:hypothetical protein